jgi:predicted nucleotidyltransferase
VPTLDQASLSPVERRVLERFVRELQTALGDDLDAVWLYGSRARGERPGEDSDIDLLVVSRREGPRDALALTELLDDAAFEEGANPARFSVLVYAPERVAQRRRIRSFFMQEVDRDKIVLAGAP